MSSNKLDKHALVQKYLDKTNYYNDKDEKVIGLPSLEFLHEIQKSISFKLAKKYKYSTPVQYSDDEDNEDNDEDDEKEEIKIECKTEESGTGTGIEKKHKKRKVLTRSTNSGLLKMNSNDPINRFPLSQPCFHEEIFNDRCGPDTLMAIGVLHQQILISQIKSLCSGINNNINNNNAANINTSPVTTTTTTTTTTTSTSNNNNKKKRKK